MLAALAILLLTTPIDPPAELGHSEPLRATLRALALQAELLDPREVSYVLARPEGFADDVALLRQRWQELNDAPSVYDADRLPDRSACADRLKLNCEYQRHLERQINTEQVREALAETIKLYHLWDAARDARCEYYYVTVRRQALKQIREQLGEDAYYAGQLPDPVPLHRFQRTD
ncbi:MAG: hypothetical protein K2R98_14700 [Gemmataceae bacterium]|nr:hypothetical protein [Gemmataceae bacterium]